MALISSKKIARIRSALTKKTTPKKYFIMTFGCQMNQADSEKIHMLLLQAGFQRVETWQEADVAIFNTCSVRQR